MATWNQHPWHEFDNDPWSTWSDMNMTWSHMHRKQLLASISQSSTPVQDGQTKAGLGWPWMRTHRSTPKAHPRQWSMAVSPQVELCRIFWSHLTGTQTWLAGYMRQTLQMHVWIHVHAHEPSPGKCLARHCPHKVTKCEVFPHYVSCMAFRPVACNCADGPYPVLVLLDQWPRLAPIWPWDLINANCNLKGTDSWHFVTVSFPSSGLYEFGCRNSKSSKEAVTVGYRVFDGHAIDVCKFHQVLRTRDSSTTLSLWMVRSLKGCQPCGRNQRLVRHHFASNSQTVSLFHFSICVMKKVPCIHADA